MAGVSRPAKTFTSKQGQYLAFIHLYTRLHRRPPASALAHPRFTKWCSHSNAGDSSEDSQEQPAASNCSLIPNCCPNYFECRFNQSKPPCRGTSSLTRAPVALPPVKATLATFGWVTSGSPTTGPYPVTTLTTPGGSPDSAMTSFMNSSSAADVNSEGLMTT